MDVLLWVLILLSAGSAFLAIGRIIKNNQIRKEGGIANSPIRDQRLRNKRR